MDFNKFDMSSFRIPDLNSFMPKIDLPKISTISPYKMSSAIETLQKNNLIIEIDKLYYDLEWKKKEKNNLNNRLKAIDENKDVKRSIDIFVEITIISIIIPFLFIIIINLLKNDISILFLIIYIVFTFIVSMVKIFIYLKDSYINKK